MSPWKPILAFALGLSVAGLGGTFRAQAEVPGAAPVTAAPPDATCMLFAGMGFGQNEAKDREAAFQILNTKAAAPVIEQWMEVQLAAGKKQFITGSVFTNGSVFCAW